MIPAIELRIIPYISLSRDLISSPIMKTYAIPPNWGSGYAVTYHTSASMRTERIAHKATATDTAYSYVNAHPNGAADVTPCGRKTMLWGSYAVIALHFRWNAKRNIVCDYWLPNGRKVDGDAPN